MASGVTVVSSQSYGSQLSESVAKCAIGTIVVGLSIAGLWWNEHSSAKRRLALEKAARHTLTVSGWDANNVHKLIGYTGTMSVQQGAVDTTLANYGLSIRWPATRPTSPTKGSNMTSASTGEISASSSPEKFLRLRREVEMYQWEQHSQSSTQRQFLTGENITVTTYSYSKNWSSTVRDSSLFHQQEGHVNPSDFPIAAASFDAEDAKIGPFRAHLGLVRQLNGWEGLTGLNISLALHRNGTGGGVREPRGANSNNNELLLQSSGKYHYISQRFGKSSASDPVIGDLRIHYQVVRQPLRVSVLARQGHTGWLLPFDVATIDESLWGALKRWFARLFGSVSSSSTATTIKPNNRSHRGGEEGERQEGQKRKNDTNRREGQENEGEETGEGYEEDLLGKGGGTESEEELERGMEAEHVIFALFEGKMSTLAMYMSLLQQKMALKWMLRAVGGFCMYVGVRWMFDPLVTGMAIVPILSSLTEFGVTIAAIPVAVSLTSAVVFGGWLHSRPLLSFSLAAAICGGYFFQNEIGTFLSNQSNTVRSYANASPLFASFRPPTLPPAEAAPAVRNLVVAVKPLLQHDK